MNKESSQERSIMPPPIRSNDITVARDPFSKQMWKEDDEKFMGEDYEPIFLGTSEDPSHIDLCHDL